MKYTLLLASLLSASVLAPSIASAAASPGNVTIVINCPYPSDPTSQLSNYGDVVRGLGLEEIDNQGRQSILFASTSLPTNMPADLKNYANDGVDYNSVTAEVTCKYRSQQPTEPNFSVAYTLINGKGGVRTDNGNINAIVLKFMMGFRS